MVYEVLQVYGFMVYEIANQLGGLKVLWVFAGYASGLSQVLMD